MPAVLVFEIAVGSDEDVDVGAMPEMKDCTSGITCTADGSTSEGKISSARLSMRPYWLGFFLAF